VQRHAVNAFDYARDKPRTVFHSDCNVAFGDDHHLWWHEDSTLPSFDAGYLTWANYWDALSFAAREVYTEFPFRPNDLRAGFGHEDWHWNRVTYDAGLAHRPVPGTVHFKRKRAGSQMAEVARADACIWPVARRS